VTVLAVTGLKREARIARRAAAIAVACGGDFSSLKEMLESTTAFDAVISFGIAAGIAPDLKTGACIVASEVVDGGERFAADARWRARMLEKLPAATGGTIAGANVLLATREAKAELHRATGSVAADMESHVAARFAAARKLPFAALRVVSDPAESGLPPAARNALRKDGGIAYGAVFTSILQNPAQIPALIRTARESQIAFRELLRCVQTLGPFFAAPDLG
jgi:adenosylhomocysteine nucleosidase